MFVRPYVVSWPAPPLRPRNKYFFTDNSFGRFVKILVERGLNLRILRPKRAIDERFGSAHDHRRQALARVAEDLALAVGETNRRFTNFINACARWTGHLFQRRFHSVVLDDMYLGRAVTYVHANPVRARLVAHPEQWKWSSVHAYRSREQDGPVTVGAILELFPHLDSLIKTSIEEDFTDLRRAETTGRPLGGLQFVKRLEQTVGRPVARRTPGRKSSNDRSATTQLKLL